MGKNKKDKEANEAAAVLDITSKIATLVADADGDLGSLELEGKSSSELAIIFNDLTLAAEAEATAAAEAEATAAAEAEATAAAKPAPKPMQMPKADKPTGNTLENTGINRRRIKTIDLAVGDTYELTEDDLEDESLMAKVNRAVELGVLARS